MAAEISPRDRRALDAAEGYLILGLPNLALESLGLVARPFDVSFEFHMKKGFALRELNQFHESLDAFDIAYAINPDAIELLFGMAWCYKRTDRLPRAITMMEIAHRIEPDDAIVMYNLACYWSLAGNKNQSLSWLGRALRKQRKLRLSIDSETDFDPIRDDPDFRRLLKMVDSDPA